MKKVRKILCLMLIVCLLISCIPITGFAAKEESIYVDSQNPWSDSGYTQNLWKEWQEKYSMRNPMKQELNRIESVEMPVYDSVAGEQNRTEADGSTGSENIGKEESFVLIGDVDALTTSSGTGWVYDAETTTLTLSGATICGDIENPGINVSGDLNIHVASGTENKISGAIGIKVNGALTFTSDEDTALIIEGTESLLNGVEAESIMIDSFADLTVSGGMYGLYSSGNTVINNSKVTACSSLSYPEAYTLSLANYPCGIIAGGKVTIENTSEVNSSGQFGAILAMGDILEIKNSTVYGQGHYSGLFGCMGIQASDNSKIEVLTDITAEELYKEVENGIISNSFAFYTSEGSITLTNVELTINSGNFGIFLGSWVTGASILTVKDSTLDLTAGFSTIGAVMGVDIIRSNVTSVLTFTAEEAVQYINTIPIYPAGGIYVGAGIDYGGHIYITDSTYNCTNGYVGLSTDDLQIKNSDINITGGMLGTVNGYMTLFDGCPSISVSNDEKYINEYFVSGGGIDLPPAAICAYGTVCIKDCDNVSLDGNFTGIGAANLPLMLENSTLDITAGGWGLYSTDIVIDQCNLQIDTTYTEEQAIGAGLGCVCAMEGLYSIEIINSDMPEGYYVAFDKEKNVNLIFNENNAIVKDLILTKTMEIAGGACGENVEWDLNSAGTLNVTAVTTEPEPALVLEKVELEKSIVSNPLIKNLASAGAGIYVMEDYSRAEDAPWYPYRDQIKAIEIDDTVENVGKNAFSGCENLETVSIGNSVTTVGENSFTNCTKLETVTVGESVTIIEDNAFANCDELKVDFAGDEPVVADTAFSGSSTTVTFPPENKTWTENNETTKNNNYGESSTVAPKQPVDSTVQDPCANGHFWNVERKEATCSEKGHDSKICTVCGTRSYVTIGVTEHTFIEVETNETVSWKCSECGTEKLRFTGAGLVLYDNLALNYKVNDSLFEAEGYTNPYVVFDLNGNQVTVRDYTVENGKAVFQFKNLAPYMMNDEITATLYATYNGRTYTDTKEYSIKEYCYNQLDKYGEDEEVKTLLVDLLNYGAASQEYVGYKTDDLVNKDLGERAGWATEERFYDNVLDQNYEIIKDASVVSKGAGLVLEDSIVMRFKFLADDMNGLSVKVRSDNREWEIPYTSFEKIETTEDGTSFYAYFKGLNAAQMSQPVYVTVYRDNVEVSNTLRYSIESYVARTLESIADMGNLDEVENGQAYRNLESIVKAMMKYGDAATVYVEAKSK